jgi:hypothetical protein
MELFRLSSFEPSKVQLRRASVTPTQNAHQKDERTSLRRIAWATSFVSDSGPYGGGQIGRWSEQES